MVRPNLADFVIYGETKEELEADWRDALKVHLQAYIDTGKCVPMPYVRLQESPDTRGQSQGRVVLDLDELLASCAVRSVPNTVA